MNDEVRAHGAKLWLITLSNSIQGFGANLGMGHWNRDGNAVAGRLIASAMCESLHSQVPQTDKN